MRVCFTLQIHPEKVREYTNRHANVWPEMRDALRQTGWKNYSLYLRPDGLLIGYLETEDFAKACADMQKYPVNARWQAEMSEFFQAIEESADKSMEPLPEVFHLD